jgi:hypothetical protein
LLPLASDVPRGTSPRVPVTEKVLEVSAQDCKGGSLRIGWVSPVFLHLNSHVALCAAVPVLLKLVNDAAITEVVFVVDVDAILGAKISPASQPSA